MFDNALWKKNDDGSVEMPSRWPCMELCVHDDCTSEPIVPIDVGDQLNVSIFPCYHGSRFISSGYGFGGTILYLSDIKNLSTRVLYEIQNDHAMLEKGGWEYMFIDAIAPASDHYSHCSFLEALAFAVLINPKHVYFIGLTCGVEYDETNNYLKEVLNYLIKLKDTDETVKNLRIQTLQCGYDGLEICGLDLKKQK